MTINDFIANDSLVSSWAEESKHEITKIVRQTMDDSSPVYQDLPELEGASADAKYWFIRGYTYYHKKLQDMATFSKPQVTSFRRTPEAQSNA